MDNSRRFPTISTLQMSRWAWPGAALLTACLVAAGLVIAHRSMRAEAVSLVAEQRQAMADDAAVSRADSPSCAAELAFAQRLPADVSTDALARHLQESARTFGATLTSVSAEPHAATPRTLATLDANVVLHGSYPAIKSTLTEALSRFPSGAVRRLHLKREGTALPIVEEASVEIVFALRPELDAPLRCAMPAGLDLESSPLSMQGLSLPEGNA